MTQTSQRNHFASVETPLPRPVMNFDRLEHGPTVPNEMGAELPATPPPLSYVGAAGTVTNARPQMFVENEAPLERPTLNFEPPSAASRVVPGRGGRSTVPAVGSQGNAIPGGETPLPRPAWS